MNGPYRDNKKSRLATDAIGVSIDRGFIAHYLKSPVAIDADYILASTALTDAVQSEVTKDNDPDVVRCLSVVGSEAGIIDDVVITGLNYNNETISETFTLNGTTTVNGSKAFRKITNIALPVQTHTPALQSESQTVTAAATADGTLVVTITAAGMNNSPKAVNVDVLNGDTVEDVAEKVRTALGLDADVSAYFDVTGADENIILTVKAYQDNDATMEIALTDVDSTGVTFGTSTNAVAGVNQDLITIGVTNKLGLPFKLTHNTILKTYLNNTLEGTEPTLVVDDDELEKNVVSLNSALDGNQVDIYFIV